MRGLLIAALLLVAGCSTTDKRTLEQTKTPKLVPVSGQVFIVTKGRENIKLALTTVSALPESTTLNHVTRCEKDMSKSRSAAVDRAESVRVLAHAATTELKSAQATYEALPGPRSSAEQDILDKARKRLRIAQGRASDLRPQLGGVTASLVEISSDFSPYFLNLPTPIATTKTDADGKFTLQLPAGQRVALAATAGRETPGGMENYYWMVWFTPHDSTENRIMLSNDNLVSSGSPESAIHFEE